MSYLLDTNVLVVLIDGKIDPVRIAYETAGFEGDAIYISSIVLFELQYGVLKSAHMAANHRRLSDFLRPPLEVLSFDQGDALEAARIRAELERQKQPIGPLDTLIAGQALARDLTLVTANTREFSRIAGLRWLDWAQP